MNNQPKKNDFSIVISYALLRTALKVKNGPVIKYIC